MSQTNILVVSDDQEVSLALQRDLDARHSSADSYTWAKELDVARGAIKQLYGRAPLIVVCDHSAELDAFELFSAELRKTYPYLVRVMLAASADLPLVMRAANEAEVAKFFTRPWGVAELRVGMDRAQELAYRGYLLVQVSRL